MINNLDVIIDDLRDLRGQQVSIFGQPITLDNNYTEDDMIIDTIDILKEFRGYEVDVQAWEWDINDSLYEESDDGEYNEVEFSNTDDFLEYLDEVGYIDIDDAKGDNSYNYSGYFSNELNWNIYNSLIDDSIYVELKAHRYGDVRVNYTDTILLQFDNDYEFYEILSTNKYINIEVDGVEYDISISGISDEVTITDDNGNDWYHYGDIDDVIAYIREEIKTNDNI